MRQKYVMEEGRKEERKEAGNGTRKSQGRRHEVGRKEGMKEERGRHEGGEREA